MSEVWEADHRLEPISFFQAYHALSSSISTHHSHSKKLPYRDLLGHTNGVHGLAMSTDKSILVSASSDSTVRLWSSQTWGGALTLWRDHLAPVWSVDLLPLHANYLVSGSADRTVHLYATDHGADALRIFYGHLADVTAVRLHPNANYVASGSADRACRLFDVRSGKMVRLYTGHKGSIQALTFSPCGRYLVSGGWGGAVCLWDLGSGHQVGQLGGYLASSSSSSSGGEWLTGPVTALTYPPNSSSSLAACGLDGAVRIWNTAAASPVPAENKQANPVAAGKRTDSGLVQLHRGAKHSHQQLSAAKSASHYYSSQAGAEVSHACLKELFFTRRTPVLGASYLVDSSLLLTCGAYNAHDGK